MEAIYTTSATASGGRFEGRVRSEDGTVDLPVNPPGQGEGTNPEELFAAGYAACFTSAALLLARRRKLDPEGVEVTAAVTLGKEGDGGFGLAVELQMAAPSMSQEEADGLVAAAHEVCPYSKATRGNVDVRLTAVGGASAGVA